MPIITKLTKSNLELKKTNKTLLELVENQRERIEELEERNTRLDNLYCEQNIKFRERRDKEIIEDQEEYNDRRSTLMNMYTERIENLHKMYSQALKAKDKKYWKEYKKRDYYKKDRDKFKREHSFALSRCKHRREEYNDLEKRTLILFIFALTLGLIALIQFFLG